MAGVKISGAEHPIRDIFSDRFVFEIPAYQRPYSWTIEEAGALLEDLLDAIESDEPDDSDPYFLGSIVLAKGDQEAAAKVIDGQQRLTTITILLAALAHVLPNDAPALREYIRQKGNIFGGSSDVMRLTLRPRDAGFFRKFVQEPESLDALLAQDGKQFDNDAQRNIQHNAKHFIERLGGLDDVALRHLGQFLISNCFLVAVSTPDSDTAYRIFAVLNDRGLDLSHADIIKSEVIGSITPATQDAYTKKWEDVEGELGTDAFRDLFSHIRMIFAKDKQRGAFLKEFRDQVISKTAAPTQFIDDVVAPWGDVFIRIKQQSWESTSHAEEINRWLAWLNRIDNFDWIPPAILYLHKHRNDAERIARFLQRLERLTATMYVRRVGINARLDAFSALITEIEKHGDVLEEGSALELSDSDKDETTRRLNGDVYLEKPRLYVLLRLDDAKNAGGASYDHKVLTVEHVLPQGPSDSSEWVSLFDEEQRAEWTHRLGNLVLLSRRKNSAAQNYDFDVKKDKYFSGADGSSPFLITFEVLQVDAWTPAHLESRQTQLLDVLRQIWDL